MKFALGFLVGCVVSSAITIYTWATINTEESEEPEETPSGKWPHTHDKSDLF